MDNFVFADFIAVFPEFKDLAQSQVNYVGDFCKDFLNKGTWGKWHERAVFLLTAHKLAIRYNLEEALTELGMKTQNGSSAITVSRSATIEGLTEGGMMAQLANTQDPFQYDLARTNYGVELLGMIELLMPPCYVVYSPSVGILDSQALYRYWNF